MLSSKAFELLKPLINKSKVEIIPLDIESSTYYLLHFLETYEGILNTKSSKIEYFKDGTIQSIDKYVFLPKVEETTPFFMISELKTFLFANETVKDIIQKNNLTGLTFEECEIKKKYFFLF